MAQSFPSLHHRTLIHCVKEEVIGSKRATKGQREKKNSSPLVHTFCEILPQQFEKCLSSSLLSFKGCPCTTSVPSFTLLLPVITSACPHQPLGMFVWQALADEDSCFQHTLISPPHRPSPGPHPLMTLSLC